MRQFWTLSLAGFAATAITFGPGRMGFGLFLSEFRSTFALTSGMAGMVSSLGFLGFLGGLVTAYLLTARIGPRRPVLTGLGAAAAGMTVIALAGNIVTLAAGVFLAMASAGFSWAPYNNAVHRKIPDSARPLALSMISTGTSLGIVAAGLTALLITLTGLSWRIGWALFATAALGALAVNWLGLRSVAGDPGPSANLPWSVLTGWPVRPLYAVALSFGITTAVYISFAADTMEQAGGAPDIGSHALPAIMFALYGLCGLAGLATGRLKMAVGLPGLLRMLLSVSALSLGLIALAPHLTGGALLAAGLLSAGLQGVYVMMMSAVMAFWSERLFPSLPSLSFTAALLAVAGGSAAGPVLAGLTLDAYGPALAFLSAAGLSLATIAIVRPQRVQERPDQRGAPTRWRVSRPARSEG